MAETNEKEAIQRFVDGTRYAADYMLQLRDIDKNPRSSAYFMKHIRDASGSAHQLAHMQQNPMFLEIRDKLELMAQSTAKLAFQYHVGKHIPGAIKGDPFKGASDVLKALSVLGKKMASDKAMLRNDVLAHISMREMKVNAELKAEQGNANPVG